MLTIRLQRTGKRNRPEFRLVLAEKTSHVSKKFIEILAAYNPRTKAFVLKDGERLNYWVSQQVQLSPSAHNLLVTNKLLDKPKVKAFKTPKKVEEKAVEAPAKPKEEVAVDSVPEEAKTETPVETSVETQA